MHVGRKRGSAARSVVILLLFRLTDPLRFFHSENAILSNMFYFALKFNTRPERIVVVVASGGDVGGLKRYGNNTF